MKAINVKKHEGKTQLIVSDFGFGVDIVLSDDEFKMLKKKINEV